ncbi:hypothetical protein [Rhizobium sp. NLR22b]|uniref:hypothetical protein n=1 Tax=Rhizobium sp. NLR22b TaxID=2731115 RepID=UPI001C830D18|nr:hypothetical protein [Rhizobium sp. NLR22b]MBX5239516.1 hypothetical protein [Rhizobium sp. NLR22b]
MRADLQIELRKILRPIWWPYVDDFHFSPFMTKSPPVARQVVEVDLSSVSRDPASFAKPRLTLDRNMNVAREVTAMIGND